MKLWIILITLSWVCATSAFAVELEGYTFLKIAGSDARAVVKTPEGEKQLVFPGDMLGSAEIAEISENRVMLERPSETGPEVLIVRLENGRQKIERIQKTPLKHKAVSSDLGQLSVQAGH